VVNRMGIERLSIELTNRCNKGCHFCYNQSKPEGDTRWRPEEVLSFVMDCVANGTKAVSFGGGEPLLYPGLTEILRTLRGHVFRSITSNGWLLDDAKLFADLVAAGPDKVHLSIHHPDSVSEVERVIAGVEKLEAAGIKSGVNLLIPADQLASARVAASRLHRNGIDNQRVVYLPQRGANTPTPKEIAGVAGGPFQSMSCLAACGKSERFCSISWDKTVAWCSYTSARNILDELSFAGLHAALDGLPIIPCTASIRSQTVAPSFPETNHE
jgi:sulfatase maturation enzyme AslB (radical SAM superfamily)